MRSRYCTVKDIYRRTRSIARPLCRQQSLLFLECWPVCRWSRHCRPTNVTLNLTDWFLINDEWRELNHSRMRVVENPIFGRRAIHSRPVQHDRFLLLLFCRAMLRKCGLCRYAVSVSSSVCLSIRHAWFWGYIYRYTPRRYAPAHTDHRHGQGLGLLRARIEVGCESPRYMWTVISTIVLDGRTVIKWRWAFPVSYS